MGRSFTDHTCFLASVTTAPHQFLSSPRMLLGSKKLINYSSERSGPGWERGWGHQEPHTPSHQVLSGIPRPTVYGHRPRTFVDLCGCPGSTPLVPRLTWAWLNPGCAVSLYMWRVLPGLLLSASPTLLLPWMTSGVPRGLLLPVSPLSGTAMLISPGPSPHPCSQLACSLYLVSRALLPVWPFADLPFPPHFEIHNFHGTVVCGTAVVLLGVCWQVTHEGSGPWSSQLSSPASASKSTSRPPPPPPPRAFL